jgi:hypothetical protein
MTELYFSTPSTGARTATPERAPLVDVLVGEPCTFPTAASITLAEGNPERVTIDGSAVTFTVEGVYKLRLSAGLTAIDVRVLCLSEETLHRVTIDPQSLTSADTEAAARRRVLRALAAHSTWDGTAADLAGRNLQHFGAGRPLAGGAVRL